MYYIDHIDLKDFSSWFPNMYVCSIISNRQCPNLWQITILLVNNQLLNINACNLSKYGYTFLLTRVNIRCTSLCVFTYLYSWFGCAACKKDSLQRSKIRCHWLLLIFGSEGLSNILWNSSKCLIFAFKVGASGQQRMRKRLVALSCRKNSNLLLNQCEFMGVPFRTMWIADAVEDCVGSMHLFMNPGK
jgi:hypothetical protein